VTRVSRLVDAVYWYLKLEVVSPMGLLVAFAHAQGAGVPPDPGTLFAIGPSATTTSLSSAPSST
jgi:hypothetical protein